MFPVQGGLPGSVLTFHCGPGQYPHPVSHRRCGADGEWSPMRSANHRLVSQAICKSTSMILQIPSLYFRNLLIPTSPPPPLSPRLLGMAQTFYVRLSYSWITVTSGPGDSGSVSGTHRASHVTRASLCPALHRGTAPPPGSGQEVLPSVTTTVTLADPNIHTRLIYLSICPSIHLSIHLSHARPACIQCFL